MATAGQAVPKAAAVPPRFLETVAFTNLDPFRLEPNERRLLRGDEIVGLTPKAFDTLHLLVRNSGHLLEKDELIRMLWPDTFVEEGNLSNNVFLLRKALGDNSEYIETVPGRRSELRAERSRFQSAAAKMCAGCRTENTCCT